MTTCTVQTENCTRKPTTPLGPKGHACAACRDWYDGLLLNLPPELVVNGAGRVVVRGGAQ